MPILSLADSFARAAVALVYASSQVPTARFEVFSSAGRASPVSMVNFEHCSHILPAACVSAAVASTGRKKLRIFEFAAKAYLLNDVPARFHLEQHRIMYFPIEPNPGNSSTEDIALLKLLNLAMLGNGSCHPRSSWISICRRWYMTS